uniref:Frequency clock protein n=1 Tax=Bionectria ochroleuca TaxID=29856 RepID=A0A0B7KJH3_BIOOC
MSSKRNPTQRTPSPKADHVLHPRNSPLDCLARNASLGARPGSSPPKAVIESSFPRPNSSSDSHETEQNDPRDWFDRLNSNPTATFNSNITSISPPYFMKESDPPSSEKTYSHIEYPLVPPMILTAHSSSASDYRSVIDDLTFEIQQLREELKHYKQTGPDILHKDRLFEIRLHELPIENKRRLEGILRDFATNLDGSPDESSSRRRKTPPFYNPNYSVSRIMLKYGTSSPGSNLPSADSAYASMSTYAKSSSLLDMSPTKSSNRKIEKRLKQTPAGLYPLSSDECKTRWRGGPEGTKSSSESSSRDGQQSPTADENDSSNKRRRKKSSRRVCDELHSGSSSLDTHKFDPQLDDPSESFHYMALPVKQDSSGGHTSLDGASPSSVSVKGCNLGQWGGGLSGSEESSRKTQPHEGAIIYYSGAPFCIDLSREPSGVPTTHTLSSSRNATGSQQLPDSTRSPRRTTSESFINYRPLIGQGQVLRQQSSATEDDINESPVLINDDSEQISDIELDLTWTDNQQCVEHRVLEACGLGGVFPEDHFVVSVTTKRPKQDIHQLTYKAQLRRLNENREGAIHRLATMPRPLDLSVLNTKPSKELMLKVEYLSGRIKNLAPVSLPPAVLFPPLSTDNSTSSVGDEISSGIVVSSAMHAHLSNIR